MRTIVNRRSRQRFLSGSAASIAAFVALQSQPRAAEYEFKCGTNMPAEHPTGVRLTQMWATVEKETGGRVKGQVFPNSVLGNDPALFNQLRVGALDFFLATPGIIAGVAPIANVAYLGFAYSDAAEALHVADGPLGAYVRREMDAKGFHPMPQMWDSGMRQIGSNVRPIKVPDDLRGLKIRAVESKITVDLFKALGANPTPLSPSDVYTGLQTKLVDAEDAPMVTIELSRWYEVNKYLSLTDHAWSGIWLLANGPMWAKLPADLQRIIERNNARYVALERRDTKLIAISIADKLARRGLMVNKVDQAPFRARLGTYYQEWATTFGPTAWDLLQTSLGRKLT